MKPVHFGGFYHFAYPGKITIDEEALAKKLNKLYFAQFGDGHYAKERYLLESYQADDEAGNTRTVVNLATSDELDRNHNILYAALKTIAELFGKNAETDVRNQFEAYAKESRDFKPLPTVFPASPRENATVQADAAGNV